MKLILLASPKGKAGAMRGNTMNALLRRLGLLLFSTILAISTARPVEAATFTVTNTTDTNGTCTAADCSLREAIAAANGAAGADIIAFAASVTGAITVGSVLTLSTAITINGPGAATLSVRGGTVSGAATNVQVFTVTSGASVTVNDLTITNGRTTTDFAGCINNASGGTLTINRTVVSNCVGITDAAGGVGNSGSGTVNINDSTINGNSNATGAVGAGIDNNNGTVNITNSTISGNTGSGPGYYKYQGTTTVTYTTFSNNTGNGYGGNRTTNATFRNTIVDDGCGLAVSTDGGYNIDRRNACGFTAGTSLTNTNAVTSALADNGGPTPTHAIGTGSAAYNAIPTTSANCTAGDSDQRGALRANGQPETGSTACDIGAYEFITVPVPITLSYFKATGSGGSVEFEWSTATETANVGFYLYEKTADGRRRLNDTLVRSKVIDSTHPQDYRYSAHGVAGRVFFIEDVDIRGHACKHGPFKLGRAYGAKSDLTPVDWKSIRKEKKAKAKRRRAEKKAARAAARTQRKAARTAARRERSAARAQRKSARKALTNSTKAVSAYDLETAVRVLVERDGLYRVTRQDLLEFDIDLAETPVGRIRLTNQGGAVPIYFNRASKSDPDTYIEFYGQSMDTLYTRTNVYTLAFGGAEPSYVTTDNRRASRRTPAPFYMASRTVENNRAYSFLAPNGDPWYDTQMMAYGGPFTKDFTFEVDGLVAGAAVPTLSVDVWGLTSWSATPDHHIEISLNGALVADERFDGLTSRYITAKLEPGVLREGANTLTVTLPGDIDGRWDIVMLNNFTVSYPRRFSARDGQLSFTATGSAFEVTDLPAGDAVVYRLTDKGIARVKRLTRSMTEDGNHSVKFRGSKKLATYLVYANDAVLTPTLAVAPPVSDILGGRADYLIIAHPSFIDGLDPLVNLHRANGMAVKIVDVEEIYAQLSDGIVDPHAIQNYIARAHETLGIEYVLLVGGDTYDYHDNLGLGSVSFIPSLYTATEPFVSFAPVDPLFADVDLDGVPDLPIGRLPVRTSAELDNIIAKTLDYANKAYGETALIAADAADDAASYSAISDNFADYLSPAWDVKRAYIDTLGVASAAEVLKNTLDDGVALTSYFGHSGPNSWTFAGLFSANDAAALTNAGRPTVVTQWGCWNTYHVDPTYNTLAHQFMLNAGGGAAAVLGASTITLTNSETALGERVMPRLVYPATTIGEAIQAAKNDLGSTQPALNDVLLGWTLLGDPALVVVQETGPFPVEPQPVERQPIIPRPPVSRDGPRR